MESSRARISFETRAAGFAWWPRLSTLVIELVCDYLKLFTFGGGALAPDFAMRRASWLVAMYLYRNTLPSYVSMLGRVFLT